MRLYINDCTDPYFNLAAEEYLLLYKSGGFFAVWRNSRSVIVGRNQNTAAEINSSFVRENGIAVVRRLTGGGAVFHDIGNINCTFIENGTLHSNDYAYFSAPVIEALAGFGINAELSGRTIHLPQSTQILVSFWSQMRGSIISPKRSTPILSNSRARA